MPAITINENLQQAWASLLAQTVKNPPDMWKTWVDP